MATFPVTAQSAFAAGKLSTEQARALLYTAVVTLRLIHTQLLEETPVRSCTKLSRTLSLIAQTTKLRDANTSTRATRSSPYSLVDQLFEKPLLGIGTLLLDSWRKREGPAVWIRTRDDSL